MDLSLKELNADITERCEQLIYEEDSRYADTLTNLAHRLASDRRLRILLLAGPSGSGKTTTANLLADILRSLEISAAVVSLDHFYRDSDDADYPLLQSGERDCESIDALCLDDLHETLIAIANGEAFPLPEYDFKQARRTGVEIHESVADGVVIIEGLHALNPRVFSNLPAECVIKVFVSVSTNIVDGSAERILSGRKIRFARRMTRDNLYRANGAEGTYKMWESVLLGEEKYLYPNRIYADVSINTFHEYELSALRGFVLSLIDDTLASKYPYMATVRSAFLQVCPMDIALIPEHSLIREFIPGGRYEYLDLGTDDGVLNDAVSENVFVTSDCNGDASALFTLITEHMSLYPEMQPPDIVKLVYQRTLGCGHIVSSYDSALNGIRNERSAAEPLDIPPVTSLGDTYVRLNLNSRAQHFTDEQIAEMLILSASKDALEISALDGAIDELSLAVRSGVFGEQTESYKAFIAEYRQHGMPLISHSEIYKHLYSPSYRVVRRDVLMRYAISEKAHP